MEAMALTLLVANGRDFETETAVDSTRSKGGDDDDVGVSIEEVWVADDEWSGGVGVGVGD